MITDVCRVSCVGVCLGSCRFRLGRQEDSHEYLRCLLDAMHEALLKPYSPRPPPELANTTLVYAVFGGRLRSQVRPRGAGTGAAGPVDMGPGALDCRAGCRAG